MGEKGNKKNVFVRRMKPVKIEESGMERGRR
jgi:hypothetical protein